jgi:hypothetical protein
MIYKGHVYAGPDFVTPDHLAHVPLARRPGARFALAGFVTGDLDLLHDREDPLGGMAQPGEVRNRSTQRKLERLSRSISVMTN